MMKGKSSRKQKKIRKKLLWTIIAAIGMVEITAVICVAGMLMKRMNRKTPEELLTQ